MNNANDCKSPMPKSTTQVMLEKLGELRDHTRKVVDIVGHKQSIYFGLIPETVNTKNPPEPKESFFNDLNYTLDAVHEGLDRISQMMSEF